MNSTAPISPEILRDQVMRDCGIGLGDLYSSSRRANIVFARAIVCTVLRAHTMLSLPEINGVIRSTRSSHAGVVDAIERVRAGQHDADARAIAGLKVTALEYAGYCALRAHEASQPTSLTHHPERQLGLPDLNPSRRVQSQSLNLHPSRSR
tara:strand:- start:19235 stop:19687 length:453 start_codon:yes stop_codon:yes gene_type:complete